MKKRILILFLIMMVLTLGNYTLEDQIGGKEKTDNHVYSTSTSEVADELTANHPANKQINSNFDEDLICESAILIDESSGEVLFEKEALKKMYPASTTKILTALLFMNMGNNSDLIVVGDEINRVAVDASKAGLNHDEQISYKDLLSALMIPSGNDAAYVIAKYIGAQQVGEIDSNVALESFITLMNTYGEDLGLKNSHFENPDGYHNDKHYSCSYDLAIITKEAMKYDLFRKIVNTSYYDMLETNQLNKTEGGTRSWINTNQLLFEGTDYYFEFATGVKTGFTDQAGYCLVSSATYDGRSVIAVVLNSTENGRYEDGIKLLRYGLDSTN
ncbi:MAG: D-alanyl-D-alanine carboxypeptidase [Firmicutes bacterium HGW-Firmicutes-1]|jgi:D-alanyl-D-alanine carboxypeptidase (penicillin-binding protein 5/6)|nr:MAG: D-alanyl-D-alanine carboxypeptidase [Firmicutes bacterium HGW-Firmicutes-1]